MRVFGNHHLEWRGNNLCRVGRRTGIVSIEQDEIYPSMWRVRLPDGRLTDMVNLSRARDAARSAALSILNTEERQLAGPGAA
jgi:hypothetical protein